MKITLNKSAKRALSLCLAFAMLIGSLFTASIGVSAATDAKTETAPGVDLLEFGQYLIDNGSTSQYWDTNVADNGEKGTEDDPIIIDTAEEFVYLAKASGNETAGKYYKVADGVKGFNLANNDLDINGTLADNLEVIKSAGKNHAGGTPGFQGHFDGNGVTVYGAWTNHNTGQISSYAGVFSCTKNTVSIKNLNVKLSYFVGTTSAGGIIGYHTADVIAYEKDAAIHTVTIENCTVTDTYLETTGTGWGTGVGALIGRGNSASSWKESDYDVDGNGDGDKTDTIYVNVPYIIKNCFVNLEDANFNSPGEDGTVASGERVCHGGAVGMCGSNALMVSDSIFVGVTPYATTESTGYNDVQHSGLESHFTNVYTDQATGKIAIGGSSLGTRDFTGKIFQLSLADMQGSAAVSNMNLGWFSTWTPGATGEYPTVNQTGAESDISFWTGSAATDFAGGTGAKEDPYIIKTADQLYLALTKITDSTNNVAGGTQTSQILKQGSTTEYVPVYTPNYYKVADSVNSFYFNNVYGNETLAGIKELVAGGTAKVWNPAKSFVGHLDGNGVNIYGMYSSNGSGFVYKLDGSAEVKNFNFAACYSKGSGQAAILTTYLGSYSNDSTIINASNISVRHSYCESTSSLKITTNGSNKEHGRYAGGIVSTASTCENFIMSNCFYDGYTSEIVNGSASEIPASMVGGVIAGGSGMNNVQLNGCISLEQPVVDEAYIAGTEFFYNRYDANQGYQVFFYDCYTDYENQICVAYPGKYDKLLKINRVENKDVYDLFDFPTIAWGNNWKLKEVEDGRVIPMPLVNTAEESVGSYVQVIGTDHNKHASVGPYTQGSNPFTYLLKGAGTEEDPYIIETAAQLARAIATGGMNLYDKLYYKLGNDIDISGGTWLTQTEIHEGGIHYTYTPFGGTLDGDGHTITGLSAGDTASAGLIPVLEGGTVKNLHLRNASVISSEYAGVIVGWMYGGTVTGCSVEGTSLSSAGGYGDGLYIVYNDDTWTPDEYGYITDCYYIGDNGEGEEVAVYITDHNADDGVIMETADEIKDQIAAGTTDKWYIGGKEGSMPRLKAMAEKMPCVDVDGDGIGSEYTANDLTSLKNKLLKKDAYKNIYGDVSRNGKINIADLAVLSRTLTSDYGSDITDSFFGNVSMGSIDIYYGENDNYDAARKVELYLEALTGGEVEKHVSSSKGTVTGANSNSSKVYLHAGDTAQTPDGKLEIIVGNIDNYNAYKSNTVATAANTYAVTYDADNKVVWLQGENFTAVEQAAINFTQGCDINGDVVYTCGSTELEDYKKPITVKLDTDFNGTVDTDKTLYYAWGDEFEADTLDTHNWQHNNQQTEGTAGSLGSYNNLEIAPVKDHGKVIVVDGGKLSMKRGHDSKLNSNDVSWDGIVGSVALDVTPGEFNGYTVWNDATQTSDNAIDTDGSDQYFGSGKVTTERGMLFKQGYLEFEGRLPADGHAFPAWWLMARPASSQSNTGYDNSLYGKIYKLNDKWNGSATYVANDLDTYKYQVPSAIYEIDMIEVMQHSDRHYSATGENDWGINIGGSYHSDYSTTYKTSKTGVFMYFLNSTVHKWWTSGTVGDDTKLYIQDWDNYKVSSAIDNATFKTTSTEGSWIHNIGSTKYDFNSPTLQRYGKYYYNTGSYDSTAHNDLTAKRRYGFSWYTDGVSKFEATLYIYNEDGTVRTTVPIASGMSELNVFKDGDKTAESSGIIGTTDGGAFKDVYSDAKVFNQYMYILFDNKYYSSNENFGNTTNMFTDLLSATGLKSFEIDYVRVYQQDGERDIVTQATENFNNNNHFGY